jgi:hypothetical protein
MSIFLSPRHFLLHLAFACDHDGDMIRHIDARESLNYPVRDRE